MHFSFFQIFFIPRIRIHVHGAHRKRERERERERDRVDNNPNVRKLHVYYTYIYLYYILTPLLIHNTCIFGLLPMAKVNLRFPSSLYMAVLLSTLLELDFCTTSEAEEEAALSSLSSCLMRQVPQA